MWSLANPKKHFKFYYYRLSLWSNITYEIFNNDFLFKQKSRELLRKNDEKIKRISFKINGIKKDIPRIELGLLDSKSNVLTITPYVLTYSFLSALLLTYIMLSINLFILLK